VKRDDDGVTLVELVVSLSITGMLAVVISAAFVVGVRTTDDANKRLSGSQGAQIASAFFAADVTGAVTGPATAGTCAAGTSVARFDWTDTDATNTAIAKRAEYCRVSGTQIDLVREYRENAALISSAVVAYNVSTASVACAPGCATPTTVTLSVSEPGGFSYSVTGRRRLP
jgi:prepilin-type N-terminal cleavage/methylation domain-containing protein